MLFIDTETYNDQKDIRKAGTYEYSRTCEVLLVSYAFYDGEPVLWDRTKDPEMPNDLRISLTGCKQTIIAHNAMFDRNVIRHGLGIETGISLWHCTMARAMSHGFPGSLDMLGQILGVDADKAKIKDGKRLIQRFCQPAPKNHKADRYDRTTHPEEWARFCKYALRDIDAMRELYRTLPDWNYRDLGLAIWHLDQRINDRGFAVDGKLVSAGIEAAIREKAALRDRFKELTAGEVESPTQRAQFLEFINKKFGLDLDNTRSATFQLYLAQDDVDPDLRELMEISISSNKTSTAKYAALEPALSPGKRFRGGLQFAGAARTRRWAGRTFQPHNLPSRGLPDAEDVERYIRALKADVADLLFEDRMLYGSAALRGVVVAPEGRKLCVSDLSNIEGRANAWLAGETWKLDAFAAFDRGQGPDLYNVTAGSLLGKHPDDIVKSERNVMGKVPELALGYEGGVGAFQTFSKAYGVQMTDHWATIQKSLDDVFVNRAWDNWAHWGEERSDGKIDKIEWVASETVKLAWRDRHPAIVALWASCITAAKLAVRSPGKAYKAGPHLVFKALGYKGHNYLLMRLPSDAFLVYFDPRIEEDDTLTYRGLNGLTRQWERQHTYGGKLVENACQSLSRDILAENMHRMGPDGYDIILTVHDEVVTEAPDTDDYSHENLSQLLATLPAWAGGFPLAAGGFEAQRYRKD